MQDILNALPDAAIQLSNLITLAFTSGIAYIVVPLMLIELIAIVFRVVRGKND